MYMYIGKGSFVPGIPARDLTDQEAEAIGVKKVMATGLYLKPKPAQHKAKGAPKENK